VTGEKKPVSENWFAQYYAADGRQHRVSTETPIKQKALAFLRKLMVDRDRGLSDASHLTPARMKFRGFEDRTIRPTLLGTR
jgi:hypothetical protein